MNTSHVTPPTVSPGQLWLLDGSPQSTLFPSAPPSPPTMSSFCVEGEQTNNKNKHRTHDQNGNNDAISNNNNNNNNSEGIVDHGILELLDAMARSQAAFQENLLQRMAALEEQVGTLQRNQEVIAARMPKVKKVVLDTSKNTHHDPPVLNEEERTRGCVSRPPAAPQGTTTEADNTNNNNNCSTGSCSQHKKKSSSRTGVIDCPVCGEKVAEATATAHVNAHFEVCGSRQPRCHVDPTAAGCSTTVGAGGAVDGESATSNDSNNNNNNGKPNNNNNNNGGGGGSWLRNLMHQITTKT
eukprot:PhM_4_TR14253/c0_g1_i1/m.8660